MGHYRSRAAMTGETQDSRTRWTASIRRPVQVAAQAGHGHATRSPSGPDRARDQVFTAPAHLAVGSAIAGEKRQHVTPECLPGRPLKAGQGANGRADASCGLTPRFRGGPAEGGDVPLQPVVRCVCHQSRLCTALDKLCRNARFADTVPVASYMYRHSTNAPAAALSSF